jgi:putative heme transporter
VGRPGCLAAAQLGAAAAGGGLEVATVRFRARTLGLLEGRWVPITLATLVSHLSLYAVLLVALRHVGASDAEVSWVLRAAADRGTVHPRRLGLVEATLIGGMTAVGAPGSR